MVSHPLFASEPGFFDRTLSVSGPVSLDVRSDPGGVIITEGSPASVVVHAVIKPLYGRLDFELAEASILALQKNPPITQVGNRITIGYPKDPALLNLVSVRYEIQVPRATAVQAHTVSGGIHIDGIAGPIETTTTSGMTEITNAQDEVKVTGHSGAIVVRDITGHVSLRSQSGGIVASGIRGSVSSETTSGRTEISDVSGDLRSSTRSGSIRVDGIKGMTDVRNLSGSIEALQLSGAVQSETTSGSIRIAQTAPASIRAFTGSGQIRVELASGAGYQLDARSSSGKIGGRATDTFVRTKDSHSLKGQIGSGGPLVDLSTRSSKIEVD